jgi:hypothetical protein
MESADASVFASCISEEASASSASRTERRASRTALTASVRSISKSGVPAVTSCPEEINTATISPETLGFRSTCASPSTWPLPSTVATTLPRETGSSTYLAGSGALFD